MILDGFGLNPDSFGNAIKQANTPNIDRIFSTYPELLDEESELTGMQLFEPAQLSLVAVMDTPRGRIAMVEDVTKKGYKITVGQLIGRHGQVTEIQKEQVKVTETAQTRGGEKIETDVFMKLKRDGEGK